MKYMKCQGFKERKVIEIEGSDNSLQEFFDIASLGTYKLNSDHYELPFNFVEGDSYRDMKVCIFIESDTYIKSDFVSLSISRPRFFNKSGRVMYIGLKDFLGSLMRGENFTFFELVNSWDMKNNELFSYIYKYSEWLLSPSLVEGLINRIESRRLDNIDLLSQNEKWNGVIDIILLTFLLNEARKYAFKLAIGELDLGGIKLCEYRKDEEQLNELLKTLLGGLGEYKKRLEDRRETGGFLGPSNKWAYMSKTVSLMNEVLQQYYFLDKYFNAKFPSLEGCCELSL